MGRTRIVTTLEHEFTYADSSPADLFDLLDGDVVLSVVLAYDVAFNDAAATVEVGTDADADAFLEADDSDPSQAGEEYGMRQHQRQSGSGSLRLTITPGSSTEGTGRVLASIRRV